MMKIKSRFTFTVVQRPVQQLSGIRAKRVFWAIAFTLVATTSYLKPTAAQHESRIQVAEQPPVTDRPQPRSPAGTRRDDCEVQNKTNTPFTPLLPVTDYKFSGLTLNGHPTFWFYIAYNTSKVRTGKFTLSLEGQPENRVFESDINLPEKPGFVSVSLPSTEKPLEKNQQYRWNFTLYCAADDPSLIVYHSGTVERVDLPGLESQLKTTTLPQQRINLYIQNKIWYDASADLAQIHQSPQAWRELLKAMDLEQLSQEAIAGSVVLSDSRN